MYDAISVEDRGKPTVILANQGFLPDAMSAASSRGLPLMRIVSETVPCESTVMEDIDAGVSGAIEATIAALTKPLTSEEKAPKPFEAEKPARIIFKGNLEEVNRFFYKRGWTDGMPVIPPDEEAVAEMLTGTDLPPNHELGKMIPRLGKATVEKVAINAVMAGALPTHMPVLIAGARLILESEPGFCGFTTYSVSTGSWSPFWVINGPVRNEIYVNSSSGALSPGNIANSAIGRAMGLIIKNIGGIRKGVEDMGVLGNPMKYSGVVAENEEESPWDPLHVEYGCRKEDSAITVSFPQSFIQHFPQSSTAEGILKAITDNLMRGQRYTFILPPPYAKTLARAGRTKKDIKAFIAEQGRIRDPEFIRVIAAGGPGAFLGQVVGGGPTPGSKATQAMEFPKNWNKVVAKYKDVVPSYARY